MPRIPTYRRHNSGQARVTLDGKDHLLGPYDSALFCRHEQRDPSLNFHGTEFTHHFYGVGLWFQQTG
jgi:hypothetical protein